MIQELLNYQETDKQLRDIESLLSNSEERKRALTAKKFLDGVTENVNKIDDKAKALYEQYQNALDALKNYQEQMEELKEGLNDIDKLLELNYFQKKSEQLLAAVKRTNQLVISLNEQMQAVIKEYSLVKNNAKTAQAQYNENAVKYNDLKASFQDKKQAIEAKLEGLKKKIDQVLMNKYLAKRANKIFPVVYEVTSHTCGACNMQLSMVELNKLKNGEVIECDQCGRILYQLPKVEELKKDRKK